MRYLVILLLTAAMAWGSGLVEVGKDDTPRNVPFCESGIHWQTLLPKSSITHEGPITKIEFYRYPGTFFFYGSSRYPFVVYLGHATVDTLSNTFINNYVSSTRKEVFRIAGFRIEGSSSKTWYAIPITQSFDYNNSYNLIIEFQSYGTGGCNAGYTNTSNITTIWAYTYSASTATNSDRCHLYTRLTFTCTNVNPTSLGRIKALY